MRAFIAIDLDPAIKHTLRDFIRRLAKINGRDVSWVQDEGLHLTLKFLGGDVQPERLEPVRNLLAELTAPLKPFPLVLKGTGFFPNDVRMIRVLWVGVFEQPTLMNLQREMDYRLESLGFIVENRPFHPHLTLGRVKSALKLREVLDELDRHKYSDFGQMNVARIILFESRLQPGGAVYTPLAEFPLS